MRGALRNPDVAYVVIRGGDGRRPRQQRPPGWLSRHSREEALTGHRAVAARRDAPASDSSSSCLPIVSGAGADAGRAADRRAADPGAGTSARRSSGVSGWASRSPASRSRCAACAKLWGGITLAFLVVSASRHLLVLPAHHEARQAAHRAGSEDRRRPSGGADRGEVAGRDRAARHRLQPHDGIAAGHHAATGSTRWPDLQELNRTLEDRIRRADRRARGAERGAERSLERSARHGAT